MLPRFFDPDLDPRAERGALPAGEAHHVRVLRLRPGDEVEIFNGRDEVVARIEDIDPTRVTVRLLASRPAVADRSRPALELAQAILKADKMDQVIRQATELGVSSIVPLVTARTEGVERRQASRAARQAARRRDRWQRVIVAACKQCRRASLPRIEVPQPLDTFLARADEAPGIRLRLILVEPSAGGDVPALPQPGADPPEAVTVVAGPEGGWDPEELAAARARGYLAASLGTTTLRAETASIAALAIARHLYRGGVSAECRVPSAE